MGHGRSGAGAWRGGQGIGPSAGGGEIVPHNLSVRTRGPRGRAAGELHTSDPSI